MPRALLSPPSLRPPTRRRRPVSRQLDPITVAALREIVAPPTEDAACAERAVAAIMARVHAAAAADAASATPVAAGRA